MIETRMGVLIGILSTLLSPLIYYHESDLIPQVERGSFGLFSILSTIRPYMK